MTRGFYHLGLSALLAGLAFALAPQHAGGTQEVLRWAASGLAFAACAIETTVFLTAGRDVTAAGQVTQIKPQLNTEHEPGQSAASETTPSAQPNSDKQNGS